MKGTRILILAMVLVMLQFSYTFAGDSFVVDIGEEIEVPEDEFGMGTETSTSKGTLTGELNYIFKSTTQREDSPLTDLGDGELFFTLPEEGHHFEAKLNYKYTVEDSTRLFFEMVLTEKQTEESFSFEPRLREAFISHNFGSSGNLILGKQKLNIGKGFGWTPTGIYSTSQVNDGVFSARWSIPYKGFNFTAVLIPPYADRGEDKGSIYERVSFTLGTVDVAFSSYLKDSYNPRFGFDYSAFFGDVEFYAALSSTENNERKYLKYDVETDPLGKAIITYDLETRDTDELYLSGLIGSSYIIPGTETYIMVEYYHDPTGLTPDETKEVAEAAIDCVRAINDPIYQQIGFDSAYRGSLGMLNNYYNPGKMGRNYLFLGVRDLKINSLLSGHMLGLLNLDDKSAMINPEVELSINGFTSIILSGRFFTGDEHSEFRLSAIEREISIKTVSLF